MLFLYLLFDALLVFDTEYSNRTYGGYGWFLISNVLLWVMYWYYDLYELWLLDFVALIAYGFQMYHAIDPDSYDLRMTVRKMLATNSKNKVVYPKTVLQCIFHHMARDPKVNVADLRTLCKWASRDEFLKQQQPINDAIQRMEIIFEILIASQETDKGWINVMLNNRAREILIDNIKRNGTTASVLFRTCNPFFMQYDYQRLNICFLFRCKCACKHISWTSNLFRQMEEFCAQKLGISLLRSDILELKIK